MAISEIEYSYIILELTFLIYYIAKNVYMYFQIVSKSYILTCITITMLNWADNMHHIKWKYKIAI